MGVHGTPLSVNILANEIILSCGRYLKYFLLSSQWRHKSGLWELQNLLSQVLWCRDLSKRSQSNVRHVTAPSANEDGLLLSVPFSPLLAFRKKVKEAGLNV